MSESHNTASARFGTFAGVFTPNILTILGIILFLRSGWVVGQAGLVGALAIVLLANAISFLTGLSLSAIATNMRVEAGGNYYLISRSLGLEIGGAIGIPLFLSQAISVAFYIIGFTEALVTVEPFASMSPQLISVAVALIFCGIAYIGADFALRIQFFILAVLAVSLVSFFAGGWGSFIEPTTTANYTENVGFWVVFAVFFPAVTGIEVGTSLSGDLKDPSRSIPIGTISSILFTAAIYILTVFWFAYHVPPEQLINDNLAMQSIAVVPELILAGVWASTLSSALGSVLAAPRTLQAIAKDSVVPRWFAGQMGSPTEPRVAVLVTGVISLLIIALGDLDVVAPIISMFFLNTYGMVNIANSIESFVANPSYRPRFRIPWQVSLLGGIGCYAVMFLISPIATIIAIVISYGVFFYLQQRNIQRAWGDVRNGLYFTIARYALLHLENQRWHVKNWRPNIIVFTGQPHNRVHLAQLANWLSLGRGIVTLFQFIINDKRTTVSEQNLRDAARKGIHQYIQENDLKAFAEAEVVPDFATGVKVVAQAHGIGSLQANTIMMGLSETPAGLVRQFHLVRDLVALEKSVLILRYDDDKGFGQRKTINIWWKGKGGNADLMLLLVHFIRQHPTWGGVTVRLIRVVDRLEAVNDTQKHMEDLIEEVRVKAQALTIVRDDPSQKLAEVIKERNLQADLTLLGLDVPSISDTEAYAERLSDLAASIGTVLLVRNAQAHEDLLAT